MLNEGEDELICDFAETYNVYDYERLPLPTAAALAVGLRENSRIRMKMSGATADTQTMLLASMVDYLALLWWSKTEDGQNNINRPVSVVQRLTGADKKNNPVETFASVEEFYMRFNQINGKGGE